MLSERFQILFLYADEGAASDDSAAFSVEPGHVQDVKFTVLGLGLSAMKTSNPQ